MMRRLRARALEFSLAPLFTTSLLWGHFSSVEFQFKIELSDTVDQKHLGSIGTILKVFQHEDGATDGSA